KHTRGTSQPTRRFHWATLEAQPRDSRFSRAAASTRAAGRSPRPRAAGSSPRPRAAGRSPDLPALPTEGLLRVRIGDLRSPERRGQETATQRQEIRRVPLALRAGLLTCPLCRPKVSSVFE